MCIKKYIRLQILLTYLQFTVMDQNFSAGNEQSESFQHAVNESNISHNIKQLKKNKPKIIKSETVSIRLIEIPVNRNASNSTISKLPIK